MRPEESLFKVSTVLSCSKLKVSYTLCRLGIIMVLYSYKALICLGVECSTFIFMNAGTSRRSYVTPMGDSAKTSVYAANKYASRSACFYKKKHSG